MKQLFPSYAIGHFLNQPANPAEFEITRFENMEEHEVDDFHKHTFYEIIWIEKGKSRQVIAYKEYEIKPGSLFFISPGQLHYFEEWKPITGGCIMFTADFFLLNQLNKDKLFELSFLDNFYANASIKPARKDYTAIKHTIDLSDPVKAAQAIISVAYTENAPLRLPLGKMALATISAKIASIQNDLDANKEVAENAVY